MNGVAVGERRETIKTDWTWSDKGMTAVALGPASQRCDAPVSALVNADGHCAPAGLPVDERHSYQSAGGGSLWGVGSGARFL